MINYEEIIKLFDRIGYKHKEINSFWSGFMDEVDIKKLGAEDYMILFVEPINTVIDTGTMVYSFNIYILDRISPKLDRRRVANVFQDNVALPRTMAFSQQLYVLKDVINQLKQNLSDESIAYDGIVLQTPITCEPFTSRFDNELTGWSAQIDLLVSNTNNLCISPYNE